MELPDVMAASGRRGTALRYYQMWGLSLWASGRFHAGQDVRVVPLQPPIGRVDHIL